MRSICKIGSGGGAGWSLAAVLPRRQFFLGPRKGGMERLVFGAL